MSAPSPTSAPKPCGWQRQIVQSFAEDAAERLGYTPGADLYSLVQKMGGRIEVRGSHDSNATGSIHVRGPGDFIIYLSPYSGYQRDRFTIAHELGHYVLHSQMGTVAPLEVNRDGTGRVEWEANWFAAGFLMPKGEFKSMLRKGFSNAALAVHFDVSEAAVAVRRQALGL